MSDSDPETEPSPGVAPEPELNRWAEALAAIAQTGLAFTENSFEAERYREILAISASIRTVVDRPRDSAVDPGATERYVDRWIRAVNPRVSGYVTPKIAVGAAVTDGDGRLLLIQRADSGIWLYPTGWADVGYSAAEVAEKEVHEETGIRCRVERPIAIFDGLRAGFSRVPLYSIVFLCRATGGSLAPHPLECLDVGWFGRDEVPEPVANFDLWGDHTYDTIEGKTSEVFYDQPRDGVWPS